MLFRSPLYNGDPYTILFRFSNGGKSLICDGWVFKWPTENWTRTKTDMFVFRSSFWTFGIFFTISKPDTKMLSIQINLDFMVWYMFMYCQKLTGIFWFKQNVLCQYKLLLILIIIQTLKSYSFLFGLSFRTITNQLKKGENNLTKENQTFKHIWTL